MVHYANNVTFFQGSLILRVIFHPEETIHESLTNNNRKICHGCSPPFLKMSTRPISDMQRETPDIAADQPQVNAFIFIPIKSDE